MLVAYLTAVLAIAGEVASEPSPAMVISPPSTLPIPRGKAVPARSNLRLTSLFSEDDYPEPAISNGEEGTVRAEVQIGSIGRVSDCRIFQSSNSAALDVATCSILRRRSRYSPALNEAGMPVEDRQVVTVRWKLPVVAPAMFRSWAQRTIIQFDASHQPVGCRYEVGANGVDLSKCDLVMFSARHFLPSGAGLPAGKPFRFVMVHRFEAGPTEPVALPPSQPGRRLLSADAVEFDVSTKGEFTNCRSVVRRGGPAADLCKQPYNRKFEPAPGDHRDLKRTGRNSSIALLEW